MNDTALLNEKYPGALTWQFGDSPALADELAQLVLDGLKTATCTSMVAYQKETARGEAPAIGSYSIILNGKGQAVCVIRTLATSVTRFCDVMPELARKEGEGDLSLEYWRQEHRRYFEREGTFSEGMELVFEEFEVVERLDVRAA